MEVEHLLGYLAGFFDGEGCVCISKNGGIQLRIINTNLQVLELFKETLSGSIGNRAQIVNKPQYSWSAYGDLAIKAASLLIPLCIEKREQLVCALEWINERQKYSSKKIIGKRGSFANPERAIKIKQYQDTLTKMKKGFDVQPRANAS